MYLSRVELAGFKSFADKTVFDLDQGITAILGPNGCGKSNVVDAIKWVLGESSAKNLRGSQMQDVIFAGSEGRKPLGLAEVTLYFNNDDGVLPIDYNEVSVTRKLFRSGESEYQINKQQCRKRDIRDLFLDTGVGMSAYSFIEQGKVEALLQAKPAERRLVIEEAAGISKYKLRRKESLARLDRTNQYLFRVNDIVEEIEKNVRRVSRQAASARRWQKLTGELQEVKGLYYTRSYKEELDKQEKLGAQKTEIEELFTRETALEAQTTQEIARLSTAEFELSKQVEASEQEYRQIQEELAAIQVELATNTQKRESLAVEVESAAARAQHLEGILQSADTDRAARENELSEAKVHLEEHHSTFRNQDENKIALQQRFEELDNTIGELRQSLLQVTQKRNELRSDEVRAQSKAEGLRERLSSLQEKQGSSSGVKEELEAELTSLRGELEEIALKSGELNAAVAAKKEVERELVAAVQNSEREVSRLTAALSAKESRKNTLQDLENEFDGAYGGVRAVLKAAQQGVSECAEIEGMIADLITVAPEYATAIETILGGQAQDIVVRTARGAQTCIEYLKRSRAGRATFLPLDRIRARKPLSADLLQAPGVVGEAFDLVDFADRHQPALEYLLNGVLIAENLDYARELARGSARGVRIVTLDGEVISPHGAMTGGDGKQKRGGLIARKAEKDALAVEIEQVREEIIGLNRRSQEAAGRVAGIREEYARLEAELGQLLGSGRELEKTVSVKESEFRRLESDFASFQEDKDGIERELTLIAGRLEELKILELALQEEEAGYTERLSLTLEEQQQTRREMDSAGESLAQVREERALLQSKVDELSRMLATAAEQRLEREQELERCREIVGNAQRNQEELKERVAGLRVDEEKLLYRRDNSKRSDVADRDRLTEIRLEMENLRGVERASQKRIAETQQALNEFKIRENELALRMENIAEKARRELQIEDLAAAVIRFVEATTPTLSVVTGEEIVDAESEQQQLCTSDGTPFALLTNLQLSDYIDNLASSIEKIGPVNMCAIEELAELEARAEFLKSEQGDIQEAADNLKDTIERLNNECYKRFEDTFQAVRTNFQEMFQYLFGGGQADLILEEAAEGEDKLDAGIDIIARPPGKEPKSISLLSGGEKALCAVGLLFAIFRSKPSPFCILDEVDGPLDESNIDRFMNAVRKFTAETQFILISHSKRTMSKTDTIYGVTQQQPGVSTKYSLRFRDASQRVLGLEGADNSEEFAPEEMQLA